MSVCLIKYQHWILWHVMPNYLDTHHIICIARIHNSIDSFNISEFSRHENWNIQWIWCLFHLNTHPDLAMVFRVSRTKFSRHHALYLIILRYNDIRLFHCGIVSVVMVLLCVDGGAIDEFRLYSPTIIIHSIFTHTHFYQQNDLWKIVFWLNFTSLFWNESSIYRCFWCVFVVRIKFVET